MRKYYIILENFDFSKIEQPSLKDCWIEIIKNLGSNMYKISPSVYEKADPALLELIERANVCNLTKEERIRYEAGLKALEDSVDFYELLTEKMEEADQRAEEAEAKAEKTIAEAKKAVAEAVEKAKIAVAEATIEAKSKGLAEGRAEGLAEGRAKGLAEGKAEGKAEGIKLTQLENAKKMLAEDFRIEMIAKITGLTQKEIENLQ
jgi:predicted transposase YdaD